MSDDALIAIMRSLVEAIGTQSRIIASVFPQVQGVATAATAGAASALPSAPAGYFTTTTPAGVVVKVPFYGT